MICPVCKTNSIPFKKLWLKSGHGTYTCKNCDAILKNRKKPLLAFISLCLGGFAAFVGIYFRSWLLFIPALAIAIVVDAFIDMKFRELIVYSKETNKAVD